MVMVYLQLLFYGIFFLLALCITVYSWFYANELRKAKEYVGIPPPHGIVVIFDTLKILSICMVVLCIIFAMLFYL